MGSSPIVAAASTPRSTGRKPDVTGIPLTTGPRADFRSVATVVEPGTDSARSLVDSSFGEPNSLGCEPGSTFASSDVSTSVSVSALPDSFSPPAASWARPAGIN